MIFETGLKLAGTRSEYVIQSELGQGLTARVYRARATALEKDVALKVLLPGLDKDIVDRFHAEANNLAAVSSAVGKRKAALESESIATPPIYYEVYPPNRNQPDGYTFMALEIMKGRKLEWLLVEKGPLPEAEALSVGMQLFRLLAVLHEDLRRTYSDFKFENLWLEEDKGQLRVTDWNVLSDERDLKGVTWDLERGSRALVRIVTGHPVQPGRKLSRHPNWDGLSRALQRLLAQMLQADPERRIQSASEVAAELARLAAYWQGSCGSWLKKARGMIDGSQVDQALDITDVLDARIHRESAQAGVTDMACEHQLNELQQSLVEIRPDAATLVATGMQLLKGKSLDQAGARFAQAIKIAPEEVAAYRGLVVAHAFANGQVRAQNEQDALLNILQWCQEGRYGEAQSEANTVRKATPGELQLDIEVHLAWKAVQREDAGVQARLGDLQKAEQALVALRNQVSGYADAVDAGFEPNLTEMRTMLETADANRKRSEWADALGRQLREIAAAQRWEDGVARVEKEQANLLSYEPYAQVLEAVMVFGESCLEKNRPVLAMRVFAAGANLQHDLTPDFRLRWQVANAAKLRAENPDSEVAKREVTTLLKTLRTRLEDLGKRGDPEAVKKEINSLSKLIGALSEQLAPEPIEYFKTLLNVAWRDPQKRPPVGKIIADRLGFEGVLGILTNLEQPTSPTPSSYSDLRHFVSAFFGIPENLIDQLAPKNFPKKSSQSFEDYSEFLAKQLEMSTLARSLKNKMNSSSPITWKKDETFWDIASQVTDISTPTLKLLVSEMTSHLTNIKDNTNIDTLKKAMALYLELPGNIKLLDKLLSGLQEHNPEKAKKFANDYKYLIDSYGNLVYQHVTTGVSDIAKITVNEEIKQLNDSNSLMNHKKLENITENPHEEIIKQMFENLKDFTSEGEIRLFLRSKMEELCKSENNQLDKCKWWHPVKNKYVSLEEFNEFIDAKIETLSDKISISKINDNELKIELTKIFKKSNTFRELREELKKCHKSYQSQEDLFNEYDDFLEKYEEYERKNDSMEFNSKDEYKKFTEEFTQKLNIIILGKNIYSPYLSSKENIFKKFIDQLKN